MLPCLLEGMHLDIFDLQYDTDFTYTIQVFQELGRICLEWKYCDKVHIFLSLSHKYKNE